LTQNEFVWVVCVPILLITYMNGYDLARLKADIETLPHLKPVLFCGFNPKEKLDEYDAFNIVGGYINRLAKMNGGHLYALFVYWPDNDLPFMPKSHSHFIVLSDRDIPSRIYRAARRRRYGYFHIRRYNNALGGVPYLYSKHYERRFGDIFCRNGRTCRCKRVHREFRDALKGMYNRCTI